MCEPHVGGQSKAHGYPLFKEGLSLSCVAISLFLAWDKDEN